MPSESQKNRNKQEQQCVQAEQGREEDDRQLKEEYHKKLSEVFVSTNREDYIIEKEDYKKGNKRENKYKKKYVLTLLSLYQNQCARCGRSDNGFDLDHFFLSKNEGGSFALRHKDGYLVNNAIPLCQSCNRSKGDRSYRTFFNDEEILTLFTKNREMTLLLNQVPPLNYLQLEIQGILSEEMQPEITIDENEDLKEFPILLSDKFRNGLLRNEDKEQVELIDKRQQQLLQKASKQDNCASAMGVDYTQLQDLLQAGKWRDADRKTYEIMILAVGKESGQWFTSEELINFSCIDLSTIDRLWVKYSQGQFGFSVQQKIYLECGGQLDGNYSGDAIWREFCGCIGWSTQVESLNYNSHLNAQFPPFRIGELPYGLPMKWGWGKSFPSLAKRLLICEVCTLPDIPQIK